MIRINQIKIRHDLEKEITNIELRDVLIKHAVKILHVEKNQIANLDLSFAEGLEYINCTDNYISEF